MARIAIRLSSTPRPNLSLHAQALTSLIGDSEAPPSLHSVDPAAAIGSPLLAPERLRLRAGRPYSATGSTLLSLAATVFGRPRPRPVRPDLGAAARTVRRARPCGGCYRTCVLGMYPSGDRLVPAALRPDILGEEHAAFGLAQPPGLLGTIGPHLVGYQRRRALIVLSRAAARHRYLHEALVELLTSDARAMLTLAVVVIGELDEPTMLSTGPPRRC